MKTTTSQPFRFLPTTRAEMDERGWDQCDVILVNGDAYIDSPFIGIAAVGRILELGGTGNDMLIFDAADTLIDGGAGIDTMILAVSSNIDFSLLDNSKATNIEVIDLGMNSNHSLTNLSYTDVISVTDNSNTLTILGDSVNDQVQLWMDRNWYCNGSCKR